MDSADVGLIYSHGSYDCYETSTSKKYRTTIVMGNDNDECGLTYGTSNEEVDWGDSDLNIMVVDTCHSLQKCVYDNDGYDGSMRSGNLSIIMGFHGVSYDYYWHTAHFKNFVDATRTEDLGEEWVDEMTDIMWGADECATAVAWGEDTANINEVYYNSGWRDWVDPGTAGKRKYFYWEDCEPENGEILE
ncbi:MAG: hypothetical protein JXR76_11280 [Deltaproteobacteria bacterium]|nr:hypothetical protein [Deltaproteobacteria bacterium]